MSRPLRGLALAALCLACASPVLRVQTRPPPLAEPFAPRGADAAPAPRPERWLVVALAPEWPGPFDAQVPDLAQRSERALRELAGAVVVGRVVRREPPEPAPIAASAAEHGADGAVLVRFTLREETRHTHTLSALAATATFGILPLSVAHDELRYALELVAVSAARGERWAAAEARRDVVQEHTLWQTAEGSVFGWDLGEALSGAQHRRRALDAEVADTLLGEAVPALLPRGFAQVPGIP